MSTEVCNAFVYWWNGEYEGNCELPPHNKGDHYDGISWFNDNRYCTDDKHKDDEMYK